MSEVASAADREEPGLSGPQEDVASRPNDRNSGWSGRRFRRRIPALRDLMSSVPLMRDGFTAMFAEGILFSGGQRVKRMPGRLGQARGEPNRLTGR